MSRTAGALLVVGDVVTDVIARHRTPLAPATDTAAEIRTLPGGAGANAACWAARSGRCEVRLLGRVGTDAADWHVRALRHAGVRPLLVPDPEASTATVIALVDSSAERTFLTDSGAALRLSPATGPPPCSTAWPGCICRAICSSPRRAARRLGVRCGTRGRRGFR